MVREAFRRWLDNQPITASTRSTQWADASRLERHYGDLDAAYDADRFTAIRAELTYSKEDERNGRANPSKINIDGDLRANLTHFKATLKRYGQFREDEAGGTKRHSQLNRAELEALKRAFLARFPDFESLGFGAKSGSYWATERSYKDQILALVQSELHNKNNTNESMGEAILKILQTPPANFIGWRAFAQIKDAGPGAERGVALAIGGMLRDPRDAPTIAAECAELVHPLMMGGGLGNKAFGQVRSLVTTALAFARPDQAVAVKTQYMQRSAKRLLGHGLFTPEVMSGREYANVMSFIYDIATVMREEWKWAPEDLWDVQGFLWATSEAPAADTDEEDQDEDETMAEQTPPPPTNLIFYGPPGTGKTFATAEKAVAICDGSALANDRKAVMDRYHDLVRKKRISFVTFHQSYAYENFVEGLFPDSGENDDGALDSPPRDSGERQRGGFSLRPKAGIFRQIADLAEKNRGKPKARPTLDRNRKVFKMSLGPTWDAYGGAIYSEAMKGGYVLLGWGGDIDWSPKKYDEFSEIKARWKQNNPDADGRDPNVQQIFALRSSMKEGDLVVISDGNLRFRAIGEVSGPYQYIPRPDGSYSHRRAVRWLWQDDKGQPREVIYRRGFSQVSAYQLDSDQIEWPALEQIVASGGMKGDTDGTPEPYVLIIDEINRANISKVFGELITLIEPDKRLKASNELTVKLPYSNEIFGVPANLHIIGTMNTADRSIALLDTALRRRFEFQELMPDPTVLGKASAATGVDLGKVLTGINGRIEYLFDRDHQIGHAYFMNCQSLSDLASVMRTKVIPLLVEYFYEDWEKVRRVLGETAHDGAFIKRTDLKAPKGEQEQSDEGRWRYEVLKDFPASAYEQLHP